MHFTPRPCPRWFLPTRYVIPDTDVRCSSDPPLLTIVDQDVTVRWAGAQEADHPAASLRGSAAGRLDDGVGPIIVRLGAS